MRGGGQVERLHRQQWLSSAGRPVRALVAGAAVPPLPRLVIVPGLGAIGYMLDLLHACGAWTEASLLDLPGFGNRATSDCSADMDTLTPVTAGCLPVRLLTSTNGTPLRARSSSRSPRSEASPMIRPSTRWSSITSARARCSSGSS